MTWRRTIGTLAAVASLVAGCASGMQGDKMAMEKKSLYDRLGGKPAITAVIDDFIGNVAGDTRITSASPMRTFRG
jgi:hemoglobin